MCRMLVVSGEFEMNEIVNHICSMAKDELETIHEFHEKYEKGNFQHKEGWGVCYLKEGELVVEKSVLPLFNDPKIEQIRKIKTNFAMFHVRRATRGGAKKENTHPFYVGKRKDAHVLCHNGTVIEEIEHAKDYRVKGETDSEKLLYSILTDLQDKKNDHVITVKNNLKRYKKSRGCNVIFSNKDQTLVGIKKNINPNYYHMHLGIGKKFKIISSEKLPMKESVEWKILTGGKVAKINLHSNELIII
jgi:predicted glutamine amidotransferase